MKNLKRLKLVTLIVVLAALTSSCAFFGHKGGGHNNERHDRQFTETQQSKFKD